MAQDTIIVIPTYNERDTIGPLIDIIHSTKPDCLVLVVDDNSPDGTADLIEGMTGYGKSIHLIKRTGKMGLGTAYVEGFKYALDKGYKFIAQMDADHSHNPQCILQFLEVITNSDLVLGSRYVDGGGVLNWPWSRRLISQFGSIYSRLILSVPYRDLTGGFKLWKRETLQALPLDNIRSNGYSFQVEMTYRTHRMGYKIVESPVIFADRTVGKSKMSWKIVVEAVFRVIQLRFML